MNSSLILNFADDWEGPGPDGNFQEDGGGPVNMNLVSPNMVKEWLVNLAMYELRRCVRARTRAICGRKFAFACEIHFGKCAGCACVRPFFGRAMCDRTFAHFWNKIARKCYIFEHPFLLWNVLSCFELPYSVLDHPKS